MIRRVLFVFLMLIGTSIAHAQDAAPISDDQVNRVAKRLYCPVCENTPLDTCPTEACALWREDIRQQLAVGASSDQIVADFVARFGERAAGTPVDPALRALSLVTPFVGAAALLALGVWTFTRWRRGAPSAPSLETTTLRADLDSYRAQLEQDAER